jgi:hypothetical protein
MTSALVGVGGQRHALAVFTPGKDLVPIVQEAGWSPQPVWIGAENLARTKIQSPDLPDRSESLYRQSYPGPQISPKNTDTYFIQTCKYYREGSQFYCTGVRRLFGIRAEWQSRNERLEEAITFEAVSSAVKEAYFYD